MILDLFAGPGGWDEGLRLIGRDDVVGFELDADACLTAKAAGFARVQGDVRLMDPGDCSDVEGLIASPPCQTFSDAGKSSGQASLDQLGKAIDAVANGYAVLDAAAAVGLEDVDPRTLLVLEPMRFIESLRPQWIAFEEVPQVRPVWDAYALTLNAMGYWTRSVVLNAANYGLPQTRKRAFLLASLDGMPSIPLPTHTPDEEWSLFAHRRQWVTMAEALELEPEDLVELNLRAPEPARDPVAAQWAMTRPATTVVRSFRPDVIAAPGYRQQGDPSRQNAPGSLAVSPEQLMRLQGIRADFPFKAKSESKRLSLIGAVVPPPWAASILEPLVTDVSVWL